MFVINVGFVFVLTYLSNPVKLKVVWCLNWFYAQCLNLPLFIFQLLQMIGHPLPTCIALWLVISAVLCSLAPQVNARRLCHHTLANQRCSPLTCQYATPMPPCPTAPPRTTSFFTSAWAGRARAPGKSHDLCTPYLDFLWFLKHSVRVHSPNNNTVRFLLDFPEEPLSSIFSYH